MEHAVDIGGDEPVIPILNSPVDFFAYDCFPVCHAGSAEESLKDGYSGGGETTGDYFGARIYQRGYIDFASSSNRDG